MSTLSRLCFAGLLVVAGLTACGQDKVISFGPATMEPGVVHSVTVSPSTASLSVGDTLRLVASVDADAGLARTVTWSSRDSNVVTVNDKGLVTAVTSGTTVIVATSTADPTVTGTATVIVSGVVFGNLSITSITQDGLPADLSNVAGQLDVTLDVSQGTHALSELYLIVHRNATNTDTTVATYTFTSSNQVPAGGPSAVSAPVTMSFNTAAYDSTTGAVALPNGSYSIKAKAVSADTLQQQAPVSSTISYTVNNPDFLIATVHGDTVAADNTGRQWTAGNITVNVMPVLYSGRGLSNAVVNPPLPFTAAPETLTTFPDSAVFAVGKDTLTDSSYVALVTAQYSDGTPFNGGAAVLTAKIRVDNAAPTAASVFQLGSDTTPAHSLLIPWVNAAYGFTHGLANVIDSNAVAGTGLGVGGVTTTFYVMPNDATWKGLGTDGAVGSASGRTACTPPANALAVTTGADIAQQSAPGDTTTYRARAVSADLLGNVVCQDLSYTNSAGNEVAVFGADHTPPVDAVLAATSAQNGDTSSVSAATIGNWVWVLRDSVSGFSNPPNIQGTITRNYVSDQPGLCVAGVFTNGACGPTTLTQGMVVDNGNFTNGYFTLSSTVTDLAGNSATVPTATVLFDNTPPAAGVAGTIPNGIGGSGVMYTGSVTDNVDLVGAYAWITYPSYNLHYPTTISPSHAAFSGTRVTAATVTTSIDSSFISSLAVTNSANAPQGATLASGHPTLVSLQGIDGLREYGAPTTLVPAVTDTTGAEVWAPSMFATFAENNGDVILSNGTGSGPRSVVLTAEVTGASAALGVPFQKVCWFSQDLQGSAGAYDLIGCQNAAVATQTAGGMNTWDWSGPTWDPPPSLGTAGAEHLIAIGYGHGGSALASQVNANVTLAN